MAAGPKIIANEFLREANANKHAVEYAPGADLFDYEDWLFLRNHYAELSGRLETIISKLPDGTAEEIKAKKYGGEK